MNGKRPHEDDTSSKKRTKLKAESPCPENTSESDTESIHSYQGYRTELANDTSDTSSSISLEPYQAEFEVVEPEKIKLKFYLSDDTLEDEEDLDDKVIKVTSSDVSDNGLLGDTSEENSTSPTSNSDVDPGLPRNDYLDFEKCLLCKTTNKDISYPYCPTCFSWRKNLFPERPKRKKRNLKENELQSNALNKNDNSSNVENNGNKNSCKEASSKSSPSCGSYDDSGVASADTVQGEDTVDGPSHTSQTSQPSQASQTSLPSQASQPSTSSSVSTSAPISDIKSSETCSICFTKPENGLFVHLKTAHRYGCYTCAKEIWYQNGGCPLCRRRVYKVSKLYY